jgi:hypothetical protein
MSVASYTRYASKVRFDFGVFTVEDSRSSDGILPFVSGCECEGHLHTGSPSRALGLCASMGIHDRQWVHDKLYIRGRIRKVPCTL